MKRSIAYILSAAMVFSSTPLGTFAAENTETDPPNNIIAQEEVQTATAETAAEDDSSRFEKTDEVYKAKTTPWQLGAYLINDDLSDELKAYNEKYLADKEHKATVSASNGSYNSSCPPEKCYDGNWNGQHWETGGGGIGTDPKSLIFTFDKAEDIGRIIFRARSQDAQGKGFPKKYKVYYSEEGQEDNNFKLWAEGGMDTVTIDPIEISFPQRKFKKLKFEFTEANEGWAAATELAFYKSEHAKEDYSGLFLDGSCSALAYNVKLEDVLNLEKQLEQYPEPLKGMMKIYIDAALSILKVPGRGENITAPITMSQRGSRHTEFGRVRTTFVIGGIYDIPGLYVIPGDKIGVFVNYDENGPAPSLVLATANKNNKWDWYKGYDGVTLSNGYNEIVCGKDMNGCQLVYLANPALPQDQAFPPVARIVGGRPYPVYYYDAEHPENSESSEDFKKRLDKYVEGIVDIKSEAEAGKGNFNVCELVSKRMTMTTSARGVQKAIEESEKNPSVWGTNTYLPKDGEPRTYKGIKDTMELWDQMMKEDYAKYIGYNTTDPLNEDYEPRPSFLWRAYEEGIGWGWAQSVFAGVNAMTREEDDLWDDETYRLFAAPSTILGAGWGTYHEIGHVYDSGILGTSESTNNLFCMMAHLKYSTAPTRMMSDNRWYQHYVRFINTGLLPEGDCIFYPATTIYQLEMANIRGLFNETKLYDDIESVYGNACRYARLHEKELSELTKDEKLIVSLSMGLGVDLSEHFAQFGHTIGQKAAWLIKALPKEERPIVYANERLLKGEGFKDKWKTMKPNVTIESKVETPKGKTSKGSVVKITISENDYKKDNSNNIIEDLLCFEIRKQDITEGLEEQPEKRVGITGDNRGTNVNEMFEFEDIDIIPGHKYKYTVVPYDCTLKPADETAWYTDEIQIGSDEQFVMMTNMTLKCIDNKTTIKPGEQTKVILNYFPENTTYDFRCLNWSNSELPEGVTIIDDPDFPNDPTHKIVKATKGAKNGSVTLSASAGGGTGMQQEAYGRDKNHNYIIGPVVNASIRIVISGNAVEGGEEEEQPKGPTGAKINVEETEIALGKTEQLTAEFVPADAVTDAKFMWRSDNEEIAEVDETTGLVTGKGLGTTKITAYIESGDEAEIEAKCTVKVVESVPITDFEISDWKESGQQYPVVYSGTEQRRRMTIDPVPKTADYDPEKIKWEVKSCKEVIGIIGGVQKGDEMWDMYEQYAKSDPTMVATFEMSGCQPDEICGTSAFTAIVEVEATLEINGTPVTKTKDIKIDMDMNPSLPEAVRSLSLDTTEKTLKEGYKLELKLSYAPKIADGIEKIRWTSSDSNVAEVKANGDTQETITQATVTAKSAGTAVITGNWMGKRASCTVTVPGNVNEKPLEDLTFTKNKNDNAVIDSDGNMTKTLNEKDSYQLTLYPKPIDAADLEPTVWSSNNEDVAVVNKKTGYVTAIAPGTAVITGKVRQNQLGRSTNEKQRTCTITVVEEKTPLEGISLSESTHDMKIGDTVDISMSPRPLNANEGIGKVVWKSSNDSIVSVDDLGAEEGSYEHKAKLTARASGTCTISASMGDFTMNCTVIVEKEKVPVTLNLYNTDNVEVTNTNVDMKGANDKIWLDCRLNGITLGSNDIYWSSSDENVAKAEQDGTVTALAAGTATISATSASHGSSAECTLNVQSNTDVTPPTKPAHHGEHINYTIDPTSDYNGKVNISKTVTDNEIKLTIVPIQGQIEDTELQGFTLYIAEYDKDIESTVNDNSISKNVILGEEVKDDYGNITLTVQKPTTGNYKLMLWDSHQRPIIEEITSF